MSLHFHILIPDGVFFHRVRYAGLFSAHARGRFAITGRGLHDQPTCRQPANDNASPSASTNAEPPSPHPDSPDDPTRQRRLDWATLLKRTFGFDALQCPTCQGRMTLVATIEDPTIVAPVPMASTI